MSDCFLGDISRKSFVIFLKSNKSFSRSAQYKDANIAKFILVVPLERN